MSTQALRDRYLSDAVETVSPARLVTMLFDGLSADLVAAADAVRQRDVQVAHQKLVHAQEIVLELHGGLDVTRWDGALALGQLYLFLYEQLVAANVHKDGDRIDACLQIVEPLRDTWHEAARTLGCGA